MTTDQEPDTIEVNEPLLEWAQKRAKQKSLEGEGGVGEGISDALSVRFTTHQLDLIEEAAHLSEFENKSEYVRHAALGWDLNPTLRGRAGMIIHWLRANLDQFSDDKLKELSDYTHEFFNEGGRRESEEGSLEELEGVLKVLQRHLLDIDEEKVEEETGIEVN